MKAGTPSFARDPHCPTAAYQILRLKTAHKGRGTFQGADYECSCKVAREVHHFPGDRLPRSQQVYHFHFLPRWHSDDVRWLRLHDHLLYQHPDHAGVLRSCRQRRPQGRPVVLVDDRHRGGLVRSRPAVRQVRPPQDPHHRHVHVRPAHHPVHLRPELRGLRGLPRARRPVPGRVHAYRHHAVHGVHPHEAAFVLHHVRHGVDDRRLGYGRPRGHGHGPGCHVALVLRHRRAAGDLRVHLRQVHPGIGPLVRRARQA